VTSQNGLERLRQATTSTERFREDGEETEAARVEARCLVSRPRLHLCAPLFVYATILASCIYFVIIYKQKHLMLRADLFGAVRTRQGCVPVNCARPPHMTHRTSSSAVCVQPRLRLTGRLHHCVVVHRVSYPCRWRVVSSFHLSRLVSSRPRLPTVVSSCLASCVNFRRCICHALVLSVCSCLVLVISSTRGCHKTQPKLERGSRSLHPTLTRASSPAPLLLFVPRSDSKPLLSRLPLERVLPAVQLLHFLLKHPQHRFHTGAAVLPVDTKV
jgi:hypothetical protein